VVAGAILHSPRTLRAGANCIVEKHPLAVWAPRRIDDFRANPTYAGDGTRIDLAHAIYALAHGVRDAEIEAAIRSRDLTHKGDEKRQAEYVERTIRKGEPH
jgi:hypothetical protein